MVNVAGGFVEKLEEDHLEKIKEHLGKHIEENKVEYGLEEYNFPDYWQNRIAKAVKRKNISTHIDGAFDFLKIVFDNPINLIEIPGLEMYNFTISLQGFLLVFNDNEAISDEVTGATNSTSAEVGDNVSGSRYPDWLESRRESISVVLKNMYDTYEDSRIHEFFEVVCGERYRINDVYVKVESFVERMIGKINGSLDCNLKVDDLLGVELDDPNICILVFKDKESERKFAIPMGGHIREIISNIPEWLEGDSYEHKFLQTIFSKSISELDREVFEDFVDKIHAKFKGAFGKKEDLLYFVDRILSSTYGICMRSFERTDIKNIEIIPQDNSYYCVVDIVHEDGDGEEFRFRVEPFTEEIGINIGISEIRSIIPEWLEGGGFDKNLVANLFFENQEDVDLERFEYFANKIHSYIGKPTKEESIVEFISNSMPRGVIYGNIKSIEICDDEVIVTYMQGDQDADGQFDYSLGQEYQERYSY